MKLTKEQLNVLKDVDWCVIKINEAIAAAKAVGVTVVVAGGTDVEVWVKDRFVRQSITPADIAEAIILHSQEKAAELVIDGTTYFAEAKQPEVKHVDVPATPATDVAACTCLRDHFEPRCADCPDNAKPEPDTVGIHTDEKPVYVDIDEPSAQAEEGYIERKHRPKLKP